ncbi:MAG: dUTP diphosphatase, partial [Gracilibacteraceae bacterium]|nr:dUTP diphosphatase [Gracilibacteraceae bacterium]
MEALPVKVRKLRPEARIPLYATGGAAGADLFACLDEPLVMAPGARARIPTGIALEITETGFAALVFARSGPAHRQGLALTNGVGVVDE